MKSDSPLNSSIRVFFGLACAAAVVVTVSKCTGSRADPPSDVLQHHHDAARDGLYVDPAFTRAAAAGLHRDSAFSGAIQGNVYAQPLYIGNGPGGKATLIIATESDNVYALDAVSGAVLWQRNVGTPVPLSDFPCGNIDPLGITGTPVIDATSRTIYLDAMTTPDGGATKQHLIFGLSLDDGTTRPGWPIDVTATVSSGGVSFDSSIQNQRAALALFSGTVYVGYGGFYGDCGTYHGWVVGVPVGNPTAPRAWVSSANGGAVWAPGGIVSDGISLYASTGNTEGATQWSGGEAVMRFTPGPVFSGSTQDYFAPSNWQQLDQADLDLGGTNPVLINLPGGSQSQLVLALGKDGKAYAMDRGDLGGVGGEVASQIVATGRIISAPTEFAGQNGSVMVAFKANGAHCPAGALGDLMALSVALSGTSPSISTAWCATQNGMGSPITTSPDGTSSPIVWSIGAEGDNRVHGFDGLTGAIIFSGGGASEAMGTVRRYQSPIVANGALYVAGDGQVYRFLPVS